MLGAERLVYCRAGDVLFTVRVDATLAAPQSGDIATLQVSPDKLHWFDAQTQQRID